MKNIWDWLKQINSIKADPSSFSDKEWELWNSYMIHRFMSMNPDYLDLMRHNRLCPKTRKKFIQFTGNISPKIIDGINTLNQQLSNAILN